MFNVDRNLLDRQLMKQKNVGNVARAQSSIAMILLHFGPRQVKPQSQTPKSNLDHFPFLRREGMNRRFVSGFKDDSAWKYYNYEHDFHL